MSPLTYRFRGEPPRVGIRPAIDGRLDGVRESLEGQTMEMARSVERLIATELRHPSGHPVECVLPERTIGGAAEAAEAAELFARSNVGVSLTVSPCWCYGSETMDMDPLLPKAVWGFNGTERPGAVYLAAVLAGHSQKGLPAFGIYGRDVQDADDTSIPDDVREKLLRFVRAGLAASTLRGKSYLAMGGVSMGIAGSIVDQPFFEDWLGMRVETIDMVEFVRRMERGVFDPDEYQRALAWVRTKCREGRDVNPPQKQMSREEKDRNWETSVKMALIARDLMVGNPRLAELGHGEEALGRNAIAAGFQGQRQWTDHLPNGDFMEAVLCSSFDWGGIRQPYVLATENDSLNAASMLFGHLLTGRAQIFADVRTFWSPAAVERVTGKSLPDEAAGGMLHLINSGPQCLDGSGQQSDAAGNPVMKPFWEISEEEVERCLQATEWHTSVVEYFRGGGYSTSYRSRGGMPVTMCRLNLVRGLGPVLQIAEGRTVEIPPKIHQPLNERTNETWPTTWFAPRTTGEGAFRDVYSVMNSWGANHGAISYGHIGADLIALASVLRIPVHMHNVPEERVFRPTAWNAFGTAGLEGADFRACAAFGPLYM